VKKTPQEFLQSSENRNQESSFLIGALCVLISANSVLDLPRFLLSGKLIAGSLDVFSFF
jgi:hypothetical protein